MKLVDISKTGLLPNIPNDEYHASKAVSSSLLKEILKSPAHYKASIDGPSKQPTAAMQLGTVFHAVMEHYALGLDIEKSTQFVVAPAFGRKKVDLEAKAEFYAEHVDKVIASQDQFDASINMATSLLALPDIKAIMADVSAQPELSGWYDDPESGVRCRYRPDLWTDWCMLDWKTAQSANIDDFSKAIANFGYHISAAHYLIGDELLSGTDHNQFVFAVVESKPPHFAATYRLDVDAIERGKELRAGALRLIKHCTEENYWPGYNGNQTTMISIPQWAF